MNERQIPCGALIKRIAELADKNANNDLADNGITFSQMKILIMLHESRKDSVTLKELERHFDLAQPTIAGIVQRLERKKLLMSFTDPDDRRIKRVRVTEQGHALCDETKVKMDENESRFLKGLTAQECGELERLLMKVYANLLE